MFPRLRFGCFNQPWEEKVIADIADVKGGKRLPKGHSLLSEDNGYPYITVSDMENGTVKLENIKYVPKNVINLIKRYTITTEDIYISVAGTLGLIGKIPPSLNHANLTENADKLTNIKVNRDFLLHYLSAGSINRLIEKTSTNSAQPKLALYAISEMTFFEPTISEQTKIANFLTSVDEKITLLNKQYDLLCQYKKGMMQKIFSQKLRFKDDNGRPFHKWSNLQLKDVAIRVTRKNKENNNTILTSSGKDGLVDQMTYFNKQIASKNVTGYFLIKKGEFAYNKSYSQGYPMGAIKMLSNYEKGVVSTLYICFKLNDEQSCDFYQHYFESGLQNRAIEKVAQEGARNHGLLNIGVNDFFDIELQVPGLAEQNKIAHFLSAIDDKITTKKTELDKLKTWKQGLLQQMFV